MLMGRLAADGNLEWLMLDSTIARRSAAIHPRGGRRQQTPAVAVGAVLADLAHDGDVIVDWIIEHGALPAFPPHLSRAGTRPTDWCLYKKRARISSAR